MKVTNVSICPTEASKQAGRPALTPELLAACGARYSRNNEGLDAIFEKIDPNNLDKSVDGIFKMIDYGHQSIADMVPVAMFLDEISILQAYLLWAWCPTAGGQESSTRYIKLDREGLIDPKLFGLPEEQHAEWYTFMGQCFDAYQSALAFWEAQVTEKPELARIPAALLADTSDKGVKQVARMKRNYAFDRSRYFLPVAAKTNMMMVMSSRGWVQLCQNLLSHWLPECKALGELIKSELQYSAPRLMKHAGAKDSFFHGHLDELKSWVNWYNDIYEGDREYGQATCCADVDLDTPCDVDDVALANSLRHHDNRYAFTGVDACRTSVRFSWTAVSMAEIRDFNRHRTGTKYCPLVPCGFYSALDQLPEGKELSGTLLNDVGVDSLKKSWNALGMDDPSYLVWALLGHQYYFEHTTMLDKFVYEAELRTGTGAHYRYAEHVRDAVKDLRKRYPNLCDKIKLGTSEPE